MTYPTLSGYIHQHDGELFVRLREDGQLSCDLTSCLDDEFKVGGVSLDSCLSQLERRLLSSVKENSVAR